MAGLDVNAESKKIGTLKATPQQVVGEIILAGSGDFESTRRDRGWGSRVPHIRQKEHRKRDEAEIHTPGHFQTAVRHHLPPYDICRDSVGWITRGFPERHLSRATGWILQLLRCALRDEILRRCKERPWQPAGARPTKLANVDSLRATSTLARAHFIERRR